MIFDKGPDLRPLHTDHAEDQAVLRHVLSLLRTEHEDALVTQWAVEFGVATGRSLALIADYMPVIGFDSFEGLPEKWRDGFEQGHFNGERPPADIPNATIVEGLFLETLPGYDWPDNIALVHFDADLYSSTRTALDALDGFINSGCYLVFDEFFGYDGAEDGEQRAFTEFMARSTYEYSVVGHGREQWAVRIR